MGTVSAARDSYALLDRLDMTNRTDRPCELRIELRLVHNGRGAYPAWPYHDGWALKTLGYPQDAVALLRLIAGAPATGAIGQGYSPDGRRCRSGWANAASDAAGFAGWARFDE